MRALSDSFMQELQDGFLAGITKLVVADKDLDLHIRDNYLNVYYKGNSLLKLTERGPASYGVEIHSKFLGGMVIPNLVDEKITADFLRKVPMLKENIIQHGRSSLEIEYEQLIIRANNREMRNNSEYFIVDRQYSIERYQLDLMGFFWNRRKRRKGQTVTPCVMEVKFALNSDIRQVHQQLSRYYELVHANAAEIAEDLQNSFRQRLELGLYDQARNRLDAMKTLSFSKDIDDFQFVLIMVDYNPNSAKLDVSLLQSLPFANQVKVFSSGFAMWVQGLTPVSEMTN